MWAVAVHDWALTDVLIHVTKNPVRCGLLASQLCRAMSDDAGQDEDELLQRAEEFETKARAILDAVPTSVAVRGGFLFAERAAADARAQSAAEQQREGGWRAMEARMTSELEKARSALESARGAEGQGPRPVDTRARSASARRSAAPPQPTSSVRGRRARAGHRPGAETPPSRRVWVRS